LLNNKLEYILPLSLVTGQFTLISKPLIGSAERTFGMGQQEKQTVHWVLTSS